MRLFKMGIMALLYGLLFLVIGFMKTIWDNLPSIILVLSRTPVEIILMTGGLILLMVGGTIVFFTVDGED